MLEFSNPPNRNIFGLFLMSIIVDSTPIDDFPPSSTNLIFFPKSSLTSAELTALTLDDKFALGAAKGKFNILNKLRVIG